MVHWPHNNKPTRTCQFYKSLFGLWKLVAMQKENEEAFKCIPSPLLHWTAPWWRWAQCSGGELRGHLNALPVLFCIRPWHNGGGLGRHLIASPVYLCIGAWCNGGGLSRHLNDFQAQSLVARWQEAFQEQTPMNSWVVHLVHEWFIPYWYKQFFTDWPGLAQILIL